MTGTRRGVGRGKGDWDGGRVTGRGEVWDGEGGEWDGGGGGVIGKGMREGDSG